MYKHVPAHLHFAGGADCSWPASFIQALEGEALYGGACRYVCQGSYWALLPRSFLQAHAQALSSHAMDSSVPEGLPATWLQLAAMYNMSMA